jgi:chromosome segregation ATPase
MSDNPLSGKPTLDTTDFKTAISEMNRDIRVIESGFRASAASLGDWGNSASGLEGRIKSLNSEMEIQRNKIAALKGEYDKIVAAKGADSKAAEDLQIRINKETESLGKMDNELNKSQTALDNMGKEADQSGQQVDTLDKHEVEATDSTNKWVKAIAGLEIARAVKDAVSALLNMVVSLVKGLADLAMGAIDAAGELVDMSAKTGISVTRLQELNYIADQVGTTTDTITALWHGWLDRWMRRR